MLSLVLLLLACGPGFRDVQKADTLEAYEAFVNEHPNDANITLAKIRLEELYLEKARTDKTLAAYDAYLSRYQGEESAQLVDKAVEEREAFLYDWAEAENSVEGWQKFLDQYPRGEKKRKQEARRRIKMAEYREFIEVGPVEIEPVNLAEDPDGPLDGFGFFADVKNTGSKTLTTLNMKLEYLDAEGKVIGSDKWPLVAPRAPGNIPIEEEWKVPVKPDETRRYWYMDMAPEEPGWAKKARLVPISVSFEDEKGD